MGIITFIKGAKKGKKIKGIKSRGQLPPELGSNRKSKKKKTSMHKKRK